MGPYKLTDEKDPGTEGIYYFGKRSSQSGGAGSSMNGSATGGGGWECKVSKRGSSINPLSALSGMTYTKHVLDILGIPPSNGIPYTYVSDKPADAFSGQSFINAFATSLASGYALWRGLLVKMFSTLNGLQLILGSWSDLILGYIGGNLFFALIHLPMMPSINFIYTYFVGSIYNNIPEGFSILNPLGNVEGLFWILLSILLGWFPALISTISIPIQSFLTFAILPCLINLSEIRSILACNSDVLVNIFGLLCISSANSYLDPTISTVMLIILIIKILIDIFKK